MAPRDINQAGPTPGDPTDGLYLGGGPPAAGAVVAPVSGTVTVSGLPDGEYVVVAHETAGGTWTQAAEAHSLGGSLPIPVSGLSGGVAYKVYPQGYYEQFVATIMLP